MRLKPYIKPDYRAILLAYGWHDFVVNYCRTTPYTRTRFLEQLTHAIKSCYYTPPPTGNFWYNDGIEWAMEWTKENKRTAWACDVHLAEWFGSYYPNTCDMCGLPGEYEGKKFLHVTGILIQEMIFCNEECLSSYRDAFLKAHHLKEIMSLHTPWFTVETVDTIRSLPTVTADSPVDFPPELKPFFATRPLLLKVK